MIEQHIPLTRIIFDIQTQIREGASFKCIIEQLKMARQFYGKQECIEALKRTCCTQLISLLDWE